MASRWQSHRRRKSAGSDHAWMRNSPNAGACTFTEAAEPKLLLRRMGNNPPPSVWCLHVGCESLLSSKAGSDGSGLLTSPKRKIPLSCPKPSAAESQRVRCVHMREHFSNVLSGTSIKLRAIPVAVKVPHVPSWYAGLQAA